MSVALIQFIFAYNYSDNNEGILTVIFVFTRRYFVSYKSCPLLFLLLAEVVFSSLVKLSPS